MCLQLIALMTVRKLMDYAFTQSDLYWLDHLLPDEIRRHREDQEKVSVILPRSSFENFNLLLPLSVKAYQCNRRPATSKVYNQMQWFETMHGCRDQRLNEKQFNRQVLINVEELYSKPGLVISQTYMTSFVPYLYASSCQGRSRLVALIGVTW